MRHILFQTFFYAGVHSVRSTKCRLQVVEYARTETVCLRSSNHVYCTCVLGKKNEYLYISVLAARVVQERSDQNDESALKVGPIISD